jgi:LysM repeat protein
VKPLRLLAVGLALALACSACARRGGIRKMAAIKHPTLASVSTPTPEPSPMAGSGLAAPVTRSVTVAKGDSLWRIARRELGRGILYTQIIRENHLPEPHLILPGQVLMVTLSGLSATAAVSPSPRVTPAPKNEAKRYGWIKQPNRAFTLGEKLTFAVQYGVITAGYATLSISEVLAESGRPTYHLVAEARTHPFFEKIFKVRDRIESYVDVDYIFPWRYEKHLREGSYSADAQYQYDQRAGFMREPTKGKNEPMPIGSLDPISCFYFFRTMDMTVGSESTIRVSADDMKNYGLKVNVLRKEKVKSLAGDFDCVLVQPHLTFQGVFQNKGDFFVWLTDDERRIPVKVSAKIAIGSININLQDADWVEPAP